MVKINVRRAEVDADLLTQSAITSRLTTDGVVYTETVANAASVSGYPKGPYGDIVTVSIDVANAGSTTAELGAWLKAVSPGGIELYYGPSQEAGNGKTVTHSAAATDLRGIKFGGLTFYIGATTQFLPV